MVSGGSTRIERWEMKASSLENQVFGHLTVLRYQGHAKWECRCVCGNEVMLVTRQLKMGRITSCGCQSPPPPPTVPYKSIPLAISIIELLANHESLTSAEIAEYLYLPYHSTASLLTNLCRKHVVRFVPSKVVRSVRKWQLDLPLKVALDRVQGKVPPKCRAGEVGSHEITTAGLTEDDDRWMQHYRTQYQNRYLRMGLIPPITRFV